MNTETGFDVEWEKIVEIESPLLTKSQITIIEDEAAEFLRMSPECEAAFNRLREDSYFRLLTGYPAPRYNFELMAEAVRLGRPPTPEEVEEFKKKRPR
jgi:hypothetical protein